MVDVVKYYEQSLPIWIKPEGFPIPPLVARHHDDRIDMAAMAVPPEQIFRTAMSKFIADLTVKEVIFGIDRVTKPNQGTKYADVLTVMHWAGEYSENYGFRFGVVNYRPPPNQIIEPIDWDNAFWNARQLEIIEAEQQRVMQKIAQHRAQDPDRVRAITELLEMAAAEIRR